MSVGTPMPDPKQQFFDGNGNPLAGGKLTCYQAGTGILQDTFSDAALTVPNTNPVTLDAAGRALVFLTPTLYRFKLQDSALVLVWDIDFIAAFQGASSTVIDLLATPGPIGGYAINTCVYLSDGSGGFAAGQWFAADADFDYASRRPLIGFVVSNVPFIVRLKGAMDGFAGLTPGARYYVSQAAGTITNVPPAVRRRLVGQADLSAARLVIDPDMPPNTDFIDVAYAGGNFTATGGGTWTVDAGDQAVFRYRLDGDVITVEFTLETTSIAGVVTDIRMPIPAGLLSTVKLGMSVTIFDNSLTVLETGLLSVIAGGAQMTILRNGGAAFTASANLTYVRGVARFQVTTTP